jgi:hypothetical protein
MHRSDLAQINRKGDSERGGEVRFWTGEKRATYSESLPKWRSFQLLRLELTLGLVLPVQTSYKF